MILYKVTKNNNEKFPEAYGKYYARPVITQTIDITGLAEHLSEHNTGFSPGATRGLLTDMVRCIKELVLKGIAVKIDDLAIFSIGLRTKKGADSEKEFTVAKNIEGVKLRARATGSLVSSKLDLVANLKNAATLLGEDEENSEKKDEDKGNDPTTPSGGGSSSGGSQSKDDSGSKGDQGGTDQGGTSGDGPTEL